ncbi:hypothetical protein BVC80_1831g262 [Macleaya cordata]|uniref:BTB/POZ-like n=1 Tax=Macleaya cordata TaxID=56857 RepID=A0A200R7K9_MACCD|nr:hypothetical protein BVC80_1831g262 [Macleaya cordata]
MTSGGLKKRHRNGSSSRLSTYAVIDSSISDGTLTETAQKPSNFHRSSSSSSSSTISRFNDSLTADVILSVHLESLPFVLDADSSTTAGSVDQEHAKLYLHSDVLHRSKYFSALLSDRWQKDSVNDSERTSRVFNLKLKVPALMGTIDVHLTVLKMLYANDFSVDINSVSSALSILPVALELLFEDCVKYCVRFLEAVPWTEDEEKKVLSLIPFLRQEESIELLSRVSPVKNNASDEMLHGLILAAIHNHPNFSPKTFVAKLLREFPSRDAVQRALDRAFDSHLKVVKESLEEYSSPNFRGDLNETEAIQRLNLHTAMTNGKHLLWLVDRMIELKVADLAVKEWSEQASFTANLQRAFREDAWRNIVPGFPAVILRCTCKLASALAAGSILASRQVLQLNYPVLCIVFLLECWL